MRAALLGLLLLAPLVARADTQDVTLIERGSYLATVGDCVACHNGPAGTMAGGRGIATPFGVIYTPNLTPDWDTGIGQYTPESFHRAMHDGISRTGAHLYPAFPFPWYTRVSRADTDAILAWLRTLPPVRYQPPRNELPFPLNLRVSARAWNDLFFSAGYFEPDPTKSAAWNRGAYLVEGLGHCGACHTPKNFLGVDQGGRQLQGGSLQGWWAPNLTGDARQGLGDWSADEIVQYLRAGHTPRSAASGPMAEAVAFSTNQWAEADLRAVATYLKDLPGAAATRPQPLAADSPQMRAGEAIYLDRCMACHRRDGQGVANLIPRLAGSQVVQQEGPDTLLRLVISGVRSVATDQEPTAPAMPSFGWQLNDQQVADVVSYIRNAWGNAAPAATSGQAGSARTVVARP